MKHPKGKERRKLKKPVDDANKAAISTPFKMQDLNLDPDNPPKYCPQCALTGVKSKVKKLRIDRASQKLVIMCKNDKCPWPFSVKSPDEVTVTDGSSGAGAELEPGAGAGAELEPGAGAGAGAELELELEPGAEAGASGQFSKAANTQNLTMDGKLYCILCQDAHKMTSSCLQDVQCKLCSRKGHLRKDCPQADSLSSQKEISPSHFKSRKRKASVEVTDTSDCSNIQLDNTKDPPKFVCPECNQKYDKNEAQYNNHIRKQHNFPCRFCTLKFTYASGLEEHSNSVYTNEIAEENSSNGAQTRVVTLENEQQIEENLVIISDDEKAATQERVTEEPVEHISKSNKNKVKSKKKNSKILKAGKYHIVSIHIELFRSNKSSSSKLTQLSCTVYGSFFRGIKPQGLEKYLDNYKLGGDLLKALHMTREDDGTFLYRSQFEFVEDDKKIVCVEEKKALEDFLEFLQKFPGCVILGVDEDSVSILIKKLKEVNQKKVKELVVGFTYWKRVLKCLNADISLDLEEYFCQTLQKELSSHSIPEVLLTSVMDVGYKMETQFSRNCFYKLCKRIGCLKKVKSVEFDRKAEFESVEVFSSFRPFVSATFTAEKLEQVTLYSESDSEPEETGRSVSNNSEVTVHSSPSEPEEVSIVLPDVRNDSCGCSIRKKDFKTLPLPEFLVNSVENPNSTKLPKLPTRKEAWQKGKRKRSVSCPLCYCNGIDYGKVASHIKKVHKACVTCLLCYRCKTPVTPAGLAAHMALCDRKAESGPVCENCKTPVPRSSLAAHKAKCGLLFIKLGQSSRKAHVSHGHLITEPSTSPSNTSQSEPINASQSEPSNSSQSEPSNASQSEPSNSSEPSNTSQSEPSNSSQSEPSNTSQSEPSNASQSEPSDSSQVISSAQPEPRYCSESKSSLKSEPIRSQSKPTSSSLSELMSPSQCKPMSSQSESKRSSKSEPKKSSQSSQIASDPNQNQQSCPILSSTAVVTQDKSKTSHQANQPRENFRTHGFGPHVAHGNIPMLGGGAPPNVRGRSGPWIRGMGPRGGIVGGPCIGPSPWSLGGVGGMGPPCWGPWNQGGGLGNMNNVMGGMGPLGWGPWNQAGGLGNMRGGMGGMGPRGWGPWNQGGGIGDMGPQGWGPWNQGGGMGGMGPQGWGPWNYGR